MVIAKIKSETDLTRDNKAFLVSFVRRAFGLKLSFKQERLYISRRFKRGDNLEKLHVSKDKTVGAMLYFARDFAKRNKIGIYSNKRG